MEIVALFYVGLMVAEFVYCALLLIIFIKSLVAFNSSSDKVVSLWLVIPATIASLSGFVLISGDGASLYLYGLPVLMLVSLIYFRRKSASSLLVSASAIVVTGFILIFYSAFTTSWPNIILDISGFGISAFMIAIYMSITVLLVFGVVARFKTLSKRNVSRIFAIVLAVLCLAFLYDFINYKLLSGAHKEISVEATNEIIPFERDNDKSLWITNSVNPSEKKVASLTGKATAAVISNDNRYLAFAEKILAENGASIKSSAVKILDLKTGKISPLQIPDDSKISGLDFSSDNRLLVRYSVTTAPAGVSQDSPFYGNKQITKRHDAVFSIGGEKLFELFNEYNALDCVSFLGRDLYGVVFPDSSVGNMATIYKTASNGELTKIGNGPDAGGRNPQGVTFGSDGSHIFFYSDEPIGLYTFDIKTGLSSKIPIRDVNLAHTVSVSPTGDYYYASSEGSYKNTLFSVNDPKYRLILPEFASSGIWLKSGKQLVFYGDNGIELVDISGKKTMLTTYPAGELDKILSGVVQ